MKIRIASIIRPLSSLFATFCLLLSLSAAGFAQASLSDDDLSSRHRKYDANSATGQALSLLPPADFVIMVDVQQALQALLPQLQSAAPAELLKIKAQLDDIISKTGVDLYQVKSVALALRASDLTSNQFRGAALIQGLSLDADKFAAILKTQNAGFSSITYQGQTVWITQEIAAPVSRPATRRGAKAPAKKAASDFKLNDLAMAALGVEGFVVGDVESVKSVLDAQAGARPLANALLGSMIETTSASSIVRFSFVMPDSFRQQVTEAGGPVTAPFASLRGVAGAVAVDPTDGASTSIDLRLRAGSSGEATKLEAAIKGFIEMGRSAAAQQSDAQSKVALQFLDQVNLRSEGEDAVLTLYLPKAIIEDWKKQMSQSRRLIASSKE